MMPLTHGSILQGHHLFRLVELDTQGWIHCPTSRCQGVRKVDQELVSPRLVWVIQDVAMLQFEGGPTQRWPHILLDQWPFVHFSGDKPRGCPKSSCSYKHGLVGTNLWAEWTDNQAYLDTHACHGALPSVEQRAMWPSMWLDNQPPCPWKV